MAPVKGTLGNQVEILNRVPKRLPKQHLRMDPETGAAKEQIPHPTMAHMRDIALRKP